MRTTVAGAPPRARGEQGFTLIELMIAVAIVGILASVAIPGYIRYIDQARDMEAMNNVQTIAKGVRAYAESHEGQVPHRKYKDANEDGRDDIFCPSYCYGIAQSSAVEALANCQAGRILWPKNLLRFKYVSYEDIWKEVGFDPDGEVRHFYYYYVYRYQSQYVWSSKTALINIYAERYKSCAPSKLKRVRYWIYHWAINQGAVDNVPAFGVARKIEYDN